MNRHQRTYFLRSGTSLKPVTRTGTWDDIRGVYAHPIRGKEGRTMSHGVYLAWRPGLSGGPPLGLSRWPEQAEWLAGKRARELGLPVVEPPLTGSIRIA